MIKILIILTVISLVSATAINLEAMSVLAKSVRAKVQRVGANELPRRATNLTVRPALAKRVRSNGNGNGLVNFNLYFLLTFQQLNPTYEAIW